MQKNKIKLAALNHGTFHVSCWLPHVVTETRGSRWRYTYACSGVRSRSGDRCSHKKQSYESMCTFRTHEGTEKVCNQRKPKSIQCPLKGWAVSEQFWPPWTSHCRPISLWAGAGRRGALVGAQQHLVLGGVVRAAALLLHQELFESARGEGESLPPQLHQVRVLQPGLGEAVPCGRTGPGNTHRNTLRNTYRDTPYT